MPIEVDPLCDPLGPNNKLFIAPGLLSGTTLSSSNRVSIGAKSPQRLRSPGHSLLPCWTSSVSAPLRVGYTLQFQRPLRI